MVLKMAFLYLGCQCKEKLQMTIAFLLLGNGRNRPLLGGRFWTDFLIYSAQAGPVTIISILLE